MHLSETERNRIKRLVENITDHFVDYEKPQGFCFLTSYALSIYLKIKQVNCTLTGGKFNGRDHFWLKLNDYKDIIIDATIKQFEEYELEDPIYIDRKDDNKTTKQYEEKSYCPNDWIHFYGIWREPLLDKFYLIPRSEEFKEKTVINIFVTAAIINSEIEQLEEEEFIKSYYSYKLYFDPIYQGLRDKWSKNEKIVKYLQNKLPEEFKRILTKALNSTE